MALQCVCVVGGGQGVVEGVVGGLGGGSWLWDIMGQGSDFKVDFKVDFKAAGNRALKEWGALFERCDGGQGRKRGVGLQGSCFVHRALTQQRGGCDGGKRRGGEGRGGGRGLQCARERRGMGTERAAADAGGVCSDGVKGKLVLWNWRGG